MDIQTDGDNEPTYSWQFGNDENWKVVNDESSIQSLVDKMELERKRRNQKRPTNIRLGMMRYTLLFIDMTEAMKMIDLKPTRLSLTLQNTKNFVENYFDQNPISQLGICLITNGIVKKLTNMSGNPKIHIDALSTLNEQQCEGEASLENILIYSETKLKHIPPYASREILIVIAAITSSDHDNIHDLIVSVQETKIRCSIISLTAEVFVYKKLAKMTSGKYQVILDEADLKYNLQNMVLPPPIFEECEASLIHMGFPSHKKCDRLLKSCSCHKKLQLEGSSSFTCPRCSSAYCDLPVECNICGLMLVSATHLARSYQHLFPLDVFIEFIPDKSKITRKCSVCDRDLKENESMYKCTICNMIFCSECDDFLHSSVHVCPNCTEKPIRQQ